MIVSKNPFVSNNGLSKIAGIINANENNLSVQASNNAPPLLGFLVIFLAAYPSNKSVNATKPIQDTSHLETLNGLLDIAKN